MTSEYAPVSSVELPEVVESTQASEPSTTAAEDLVVTFFQVSKPKKVVSISKDLTVKDLKEIAFADDVALNKRIRFIHHGQVLDDRKILKDTGLMRSQFVHVAVTDPLPASAASRRTSERSTLDEDIEDPEAADFRFAQMLAERDGVGPDEALDLEAATFEVPEGDSRDFLWGFLLASLFGYIMVIFLWQPRISRRLRLGILCGMMVFILNGMSRVNSATS